MMNEAGLQRTLPDQSSGSGHTFDSPRHPIVINPIISKRVCFYKSGDPQFSGLRMVINNRSFKTFDALLDSLSKKVPLPFGVRNITTPRGVHGINALDELEDGKSYICSDNRKVIPINIALARRKMPPWYHVRPVSARRHNVQQARHFPGSRIQGYESMASRTPKRLVVFRNGEPAVKHFVMLHKKTTPTYESILGYISELIQSHVVKLHTPDGRRIDGLPGLLMCSGIVVAVGREAFRPALYTAEESPAPTKQHANRTGFRRPKASNHKEKLLPYSSRNFSASSERYIIHQIHNTIAESSSDLTSNPAKSVELDSSRRLESVVETEEDGSLGDGAAGQDCCLPSDDNIEKSFRVNQDGSMTVEMKVRLTIKEEEAIHWTTTLTRSSVADRLNVTSLPEPEAEQEVCSAQLDSLNSQSPAASVDDIDKGKTRDNNDEDPPSLGGGVVSNGNNEEEADKMDTDIIPPRRPPTPGLKKVRKQQTSVESIQSITPDGVQEEMVGSYSYREQTENGTISERHCVVKENTTRPVPKPRRLSSIDSDSRNISAHKSGGIAQTQHLQSSDEEITETVLHIYEQQTCQDNFLANTCSRGMSASAVTFSRPATSHSGQLSSNNEFEPELWRPSTASDAVSIWRAENMSAPSDPRFPPLKINSTQEAERQPSQMLTKGSDKLRQKEISKNVRISSKPTMTDKHIRKAATERKRQKENSAEAKKPRKKVKTFSSSGFLKRIYGNKLTSTKGIKKPKKRPKQHSGFKTRSSPISDATIKNVAKGPNIDLKEKKSGRVSFETSSKEVSPTEVSQPRGVLTRQIHLEKMNEKESQDVTRIVGPPAFNSSCSMTKEYVENWLEKANLTSSSSSEEKSKMREPGRRQDYVAEALEVMCLEKASEMVACKASESSPTNLDATSVKLRVQAFENRSSPPLEKATVSQQSPHNHTAAVDTNMCKTNAQEAKPFSNTISSEVIPPKIETATAMVPESDVENSVRISFEDVTLVCTPSVELPPPPPELLSTEFCSMDVLSVASSPLYRLSSVSSRASDNHPSSVSPTSDKATSPTDNTTEKTTPTQMDIPSTWEGTELSRSPSIKRAPLVSNLSLERKMSLRRARLDKYTSDNDASVEMTALPSPINTVGDEVSPYGICSTGTQQPLKVPPEETQESVLDSACTPSICSSVFPTSQTSDERMSSSSISSSEASIAFNVSFRETKLAKMPQKGVPSPKTMEKREKWKSSVLPERKSQNKKRSAELQEKSTNLRQARSPSLDKSLLPNIVKQKHVSANASPSPERKSHKSKVKQRLSPYSQSLDVTSPPVRHKSSRKELLSINLSLDSHSEAIRTGQEKTSAERKCDQTPQSGKPAAGADETPTSVEFGQNDENKILTAVGQDQFVTETRGIQQSTSFNTKNQPDIKPVLEEICYSIKSIRQITQRKHPSCLEKSNSLPDFSSHVASTFGSSSKALLAFLSVMTLKEGLTNLNVGELNANNISCAEALKMIDSLREIATIEDSHQLKTSLLKLQQSASEQLLKSWKGFQELSDRCTSRSSTPHLSEPSLLADDGPALEESVIDEIMDNLDIPETLKEELACLSETEKRESENEIKFIDEHFATEDNTSHEEDINQPKQSGISSLDLATKTGDNSAATAETTPEPIPKERQLHNASSSLNSFRAEVQKSQKQQLSNKDETLKNLDKESCSSKTEEQNIEGGQLKVESEDSICETEFTPDKKSCSAENKQESLCANTTLTQTDKSEEVVARQSSDDKEIEIAYENIKLRSSEGEGLPHPDDPSEDQDEELSSSYVEINVSVKESIVKPNQNQVSETEQLSQMYSMGVSTSTDESTENSDGNETSSEEEPPVVDCKKLQVIVEESLSDNEEDQDDEFIGNLPNLADPGRKSRALEALIEEEVEEDQVSSGDEHLHPNESKSSQSQGFSNVTENQESNLPKENMSWLISDSLGKGFKFNADDDSGNDHSSCEEHVDEEQIKVKDQQISSSVDEELSFYEKESSSEEEQTNISGFVGDSHTRQQETSELAISPDREEVLEKLKYHPEEVITQSVAERIIRLEKQVVDAQEVKNTSSSTIRRWSQRKPLLESDEEDSASGSGTSRTTPCARSAPQSSLSFSYDSRSVITTEPESSRVRSIREMFLAKSAADTQQKRFPSSNSSEVSGVRAETSGSGGYQSQTSSEQSSSEDDSARKSISKGFVRRAIERLYGKKDTNTGEAGDRPPSEPNQRKKEEQPSIFSPFHVARSKAMSEFSYFSSTNALDALTEAARCIAFNVQVGPGDSVSVDNGQWLMRENTLMRKSASDPVGIHKSFTSTPMDEGLSEDTKPNAPYSLFSSKPESEDEAQALPSKCTYFSMPHASDSEACPDDVSSVSKSSVNGDGVPEADNTKAWTERNGMLPGSGITDFRMMDNKVHPLVEHPPDGEVVLAQPGKGHGVVNRRLQEPDVLDLLYNFCGQHCPIL